jgi:hypothetical protein
MKTLPLRCSRSVRGLLALAALAALQTRTHAQVFAGHGVISEYTNSGTLINPTLVPDGNEDVAVSGSTLYTLDNEGTIGKYTLSGTPINSTLAVASPGAYGFAISGSDIFVSNDALNTVEEYTTSGATVTKTLISGLSGVYDIDVSGSDLFVENSGVISEYTTSGTLVNADLITGIVGSVVVVSGSDLYVDNASGIGEYTTSGAIVNADLIPVPFVAGDLAVDGSDLLVSNGTTGTVAEYTLSGTLVNPTFITGLGFTTGLAVINNVPEAPWNAAPYLGLLTLGFALTRRRRMPA